MLHDVNHLLPDGTNLKYHKILKQTCLEMMFLCKNLLDIISYLYPEFFLRRVPTTSNFKNILHKSTWEMDYIPWHAVHNTFSLSDWASF